MLLNLNRLRETRGFTLIEVLVVVMLIGVLAAIAIPAYMNHQKKGMDADAESNARNLVSKLELCYATTEDYQQCDTPVKLGGDVGLPYGTNPGEVSIISTTKTGFKVTAVSKAETDGSDHTYSVEKDITGVAVRSCTAGATNNNGACKNGSW